MGTREPLVTASFITALVTAVIALVVALGIDISDDQQTAILGLCAALAPVAVALLARSKVTPVADPRSASGERLVVAPRSEINP